MDYIRENTETVEGVGDVCSLSAFDFARHGNAHYGSPFDAPKVGVTNSEGVWLL